MVAFYTMMPNVSEGMRNWSLFTSLTLIATDRPPALSVAWTLTHEMTFYTLFAVTYFTRLWRFGLAAWVLAIGAAWAFDLRSDIGVLRVLLAPINLEFVLGVGLAWLAIRYRWTWFGWRGWPLGLLLGDASYSLYLIHNPLISIGARLVRGIGHWNLTLIICVGIGVAGGLIYHVGVEKPLIRWARRFPQWRSIAAAQQSRSGCRRR